MSLPYVWNCNTFSTFNCTHTAIVSELWIALILHLITLILSQKSVSLVQTPDQTIMTVTVILSSSTAQNVMKSSTKCHGKISSNIFDTCTTTTSKQWLAMTAYNDRTSLVLEILWYIAAYHIESKGLQSRDAGRVRWDTEQSPLNTNEMSPTVVPSLAQNALELYTLISDYN